MIGLSFLAEIFGKINFSKVFIVYEYLSETREETIVIGSICLFIIT